MSKLGQRLIAAVKEARAIARGEPVPGAVIHTPLDVKAIRTRLGLTQPEFAERFGISVGSLRDWEQERVAPDAAARTLLLVIDTNPKAVEKAVTADRKARMRLGGPRPARRARAAASPAKAAGPR